MFLSLFVLEDEAKEVKETEGDAFAGNYVARVKQQLDLRESTFR